MSSLVSRLPSNKLTEREVWHVTATFLYFSHFSVILVLELPIRYVSYYSLIASKCALFGLSCDPNHKECS